MHCVASRAPQAVIDTQGDLNLNICEAHAFNTLDKFSLDVFVVNGWKGQVGFSHSHQSQWAAFVSAVQLLHTHA